MVSQNFQVHAASCRKWNTDDHALLKGMLPKLDDLSGCIYSAPSRPLSVVAVKLGWKAYTNLEQCISTLHHSILQHIDSDCFCRLPLCATSPPITGRAAFTHKPPDACTSDLYIAARKHFQSESMRLSRMHSLTQARLHEVMRR